MLPTHRLSLLLARVEARRHLRQLRNGHADLQAFIKQHVKPNLATQPYRSDGYLSEIIRAARATGDYRSLSESLTLQASLRNRFGLPAETLLLATEARLAAQQAGTWQQQAAAEYVLATLHLDLGDHATAESILFQLITTARLHSDALREADYLFVLGQLRTEQLRHCEAASLFAVAHATYAREHDPNAAWSLNMRAHAHLRNNELDLALEAALQSVSAAQDASNGDLAEFLLTAASVQLKRGDLVECDKLIDAASASDRAICKRLQAEIATVSGRLLLQRGNIEKAIAKLQSAVTLAERVAVASTERDARAALETAYRAAGRTTEAEASKRALRRLADRQAQIKAQQQRDTRSVQHRVSELVVQWNSMPSA